MEIMHVAFGHCKRTSRPFFFTQALRPSTFQDVILTLPLRPSLLVILSGGSSYNIGASGSLAFLVFFAEAVRWNTHTGWGKWRIQHVSIYKKSFDSGKRESIGGHTGASLILPVSGRLLCLLSSLHTWCRSDCKHTSQTHSTHTQHYPSRWGKRGLNYVMCFSETFNINMHEFNSCFPLCK